MTIQALDAETRDERDAAFYGGERQRAPTKAELEHFTLASDRISPGPWPNSGIHVVPQDAGLRRVLLDGFLATEAPTEWAIWPTFPRRVVTLISGHGGSGKSVFALTLAAAAACGFTYCGFTSDRPLRVVVASLEDDGGVVRYRLRRIVETLALDSALLLSNLVVLDCPDSDATLVTETIKAGVRTLAQTPRLAAIDSAMEGADLVIIDNASDAFAANENDRSAVRAFMRELMALAQRHHAAVALVCHIDKASARAGSQGQTYSGSTAWHNSARSRLALLPQKDGTVVLTVEKHQYGPSLEPVSLSWTSNGLLMPVDARQQLNALAAREDADKAVALDVLAAGHAAGIEIPTASRGRANLGTSLSLLPSRPQLTRSRDGIARLHAALLALERDGMVMRVQQRDAHRNKREFWALANSQNA